MGRTTSASLSQLHFMKINDTIIAIATALAPAGIGVLRLSGPQAISIVDPLFKAKRSGFSLQNAISHKLYYGTLEEHGILIDEVLITVMRSPHSYTTENIIEIQAHGSVLVLRTILRKILDRGARLAEPGEFTRRAFFYGRLDLTQVEAVADLIHAQSQLGMQMALHQLQGKLYQQIKTIQEDVFHVLALVEASIDFPEEGILFTHQQDCVQRIEKCLDAVNRLLQNANQGKQIRNGIAVALVGRPNVGKSSLFNALLQEQRAIVTAIPGTTRDLIEESFQIEGVAIRLTDTAGIRKTKNIVEQQGVERSQQILESADLLLLLIDASQSLTPKDLELLHQVDLKKTIVVLNKSDLLTDSLKPLEIPADVKTLVISVKNQEGLDQLKQAILEQALGGQPQKESVFITNLRQQQAVQKAKASLEWTYDSLQDDRGEECVAVDLQGALRALGEVVGETTSDDLLNHIFASFCIGK